MPGQSLSPQQRETLLAIDDLIRDADGVRPTLREILGRLGLSQRSTAWCKLLVDHLRGRGLVTYRSGEQRTISITPAGRAELRSIRASMAATPQTAEAVAS